jgi:hypothetical protein
MKSSFTVTCGCGEAFPLNAIGTQFPKDAQCPKCRLAIWLVEPLGNVVGMTILGRAATELKNGDWTLAIVLGAMAIECELVYLFMKWRRIDLMSARMPTDTDQEEWEQQWRDDVRTIAARLDKVSRLLTGQAFDSFLSKHTELLQTIQSRYPAYKGVTSPKDFFVRELFHRRNKIVHLGEIDFQQADAEMCFTLATSLSQILASMDAQARQVLDTRYKAAQSQGRS